MAMDTKSPSESKGLTSTEEEILRAVNELRFVTVEEILRLLFKKGSKTYVRKILRSLAGGQDGKMNEQLFRLRLPAAGGNHLRIYTLGRAGARFLRHSGVPVPFFYRPQSASYYSYGYLMHQLTLTKFLVAMRVFVRDHPSYHLADTLTSYAMAGNAPHITLVSEDGKERTVGVIPDCWVYVEYRESEDNPQSVQGMPLWVELDHGTESRSRFQELVLNRLTLIRDKKYEEYFGTSSVRFCYLAFGRTREARLSRLFAMVRWVEEVLSEKSLISWGRLFHFATIEPDLYESHALFTNAVWHKPFSHSAVSLFPIPKDLEESHGHKTTPQEPRANE
jgi:protein involved in plasmid replication-relaxation